jgi:hypothetical protein
MPDRWGAVLEAGTDQLAKLAAGSEPQTVAPLPDLGVKGVVQAVDAAGNMNGSNGGGVDPNGACCPTVHVVKSAAGAKSPTVLPFKGVDGIGGMAVDGAGNVYLVDGDRDRVLKLAAGSDTPTVLPFTGLDHPTHVAVDTAGSVYAVDGGHRRVLKLAAEGS